ncbi:hypothetical protein CEXT_741141 [Caerostris extrusa]|uniref:Uncharacterized protein n=1 Tax=Caerostris extrusa TaxID=172846 RepID=A0AAV4SUZ6_CAEEX|nr:hypothetical protein CEXT_741141 [Caerostris extrusa]
MPPDPFLLVLRVKQEIEAGICNKKRHLCMKQAIPLRRRGRGDPSNLTNGSSLEKTGKEGSNNGSERGGSAERETNEELSPRARVSVSGKWIYGWVSRIFLVA